MSSLASQKTQHAKSPRSKVVCHCLRITEADIENAIDAGTVRTIKCVIRETSAGSGCTACHCTIRKLLANTPANCDRPNSLAVANS